MKKTANLRSFLESEAKTTPYRLFGLFYDKNVDFYPGEVNFFPDDKNVNYPIKSNKIHKY